MEAESISFDAGLRMDGIPALDLWDVVIEVFHSSPNQKEKFKERVKGNLLRHTPSNKHAQNQAKTPIQPNTFDLSNVDDVSSNAKSSQFGAMLSIFEDNEAVIKMIVNGRSPTKRHVSRTHRVALDWLSDRINLDPKIPIKYVDTKHQLADILTTEISHVMSGTIFSNCLPSAISAQFAALRISAPPAARKRWQKRMQEETGVDRTPTRTTHLCTYSASQNAPHRCFTHANTRGSSRLPWCVKSSVSSQLHVSHVAALATEHFYTISLTKHHLFSDHLLSQWPVLSRPILDWSMKPCETQGGYTKSASPTGYWPKLTQSGDFEPQEIESDRNLEEDLQPRRIELDRNIGTDPYQIPERILGDDYQHPITEETEETGKFWRGHALRPIKDTLGLRFSWKHCRLGSWRWRITKNASLTAVCIWVKGKLRFFSKTHSLRETRSKKNTEERASANGI